MGGITLFDDAHKIHSWMKDHVNRVVDVGLMKGYPDGSFRPDASITRGEYAVGLSRVISLMAELADVDRRDLLKGVANSVVQIQRDGAVGSGVVVSETGHILTNAHVVAEAGYVLVSWESAYADPSYPNFVGADGFVAAVDKENDLALVKVNFDPSFIFSPAKFAEPGTVMLGDRLFIQGSPLGFGGRVSDGIYNGTRTLSGVTYLDIAGAINPGNSGGPIFNSKGELVGLVVAKIVDVAIEGFGLGIPMNRILPFLEKHGVKVKG
jgi:serine protease Do